MSWRRMDDISLTQHSFALKAKHCDLMSTSLLYGVAAGWATASLIITLSATRYMNPYR